jgi:hypothetical protein
MTRINVGYAPHRLNTKMLIAEHREIKRIPNTIRSGKARLEGIPERFTLGTGHVKFFYNKLGYLLERYKAIHEECLKRGYKVQDYSESWQGIPKDLMGFYHENEEDSRLIENRIKERLNEEILLFKKNY